MNAAEERALRRYALSLEWSARMRDASDRRTAPGAFDRYLRAERVRCGGPRLLLAEEEGAADDFAHLAHTDRERSDEGAMTIATDPEATA